MPIALSVASIVSFLVIASATVVALSSLGTLAVLALLVRWARNDPGKLGPLVPEPPSIQSEDDPAGAANGAEMDPWDAIDDAEPAPDVPLEAQVDACLEVLRTGKPGPCRQAVDTLVALGASALPLLQTALVEADQDVRVDVQSAIDGIDAAPAS